MTLLWKTLSIETNPRITTLKLQRRNLFNSELQWSRKGIWRKFIFFTWAVEVCKLEVTDER